MKLLMENFRKYVIEEEIENYIKSEQKLTEKDLRKFIKELYSQNKLVLTEEQLDEALPRWMKKAGQYAGVGAALAGVGGPATAQADTAGLGGRAKEKMAQMIDKAQEKGQQVIDKLPAAVDRTSGAEADAGGAETTPISDGYQQNADGTHEFRVKLPVEKYETHGGKSIGEHRARVGLMQALQGEGIVTGDQISGISLSYDRANGQVVAKWSPTSSATSSAINKAMGN